MPKKKKSEKKNTALRSKDSESENYKKKARQNRRKSKKAVKDILKEKKKSKPTSHASRKSGSRTSEKKALLNLSSRIKELTELSNTNKKKEKNQSTKSAEKSADEIKKTKSLGNLIDSFEGRTAGSGTEQQQGSISPSKFITAPQPSLQKSENQPVNAQESLEKITSEVSTSQVNDALNNLTSRGTYETILSLVESFYKGENIGYEGIELLRTFQNFFMRGGDNRLIADYQNYMTEQQSRNLTRIEYLTNFLSSHLRQYIPLSSSLNVDDSSSIALAGISKSYRQAEFIETAQLPGEDMQRQDLIGRRTILNSLTNALKEDKQRDQRKLYKKDLK